MGLRKGEYVGFWCPPELKRKLQEAAQSEYRDLSKEVIKRLDESFKEKTERQNTEVQNG